MSVTPTTTSATPTTGQAAARRPLPLASARILNDCRDLAIHRLVLSFSSMLDRVSDLLMTRAERSDVREDQVLFLDSRGTLNSERGNLMAAFEHHLREMVDRRMSGEDSFKANFATADMRNLTLIDTAAMDESVVLSNIVRVVENLCSEELQEFNRSVGYLLGRPELETASNPFAPTTIVQAFTEALRGIKGDPRIKVTILKELNQASLGDINSIYADLNKHLANMHVVPPMRGATIQRSIYPGTTGTPREREVRAEVPEPPSAAPPQQEGDLLAMLHRLANAGIGIGRMQPSFRPATAEGGLPLFDLMSATKVGPFGGPRILMTQEIGTALSRLQQGETGFDFDGVPVELTGVPQGMHNVLRDLQDSPIGAKANQLEAMTIELVAMLFDFIFETKDLPDSMKVLIGRLQIPVLKAAMLDGAFFSKKAHPSRLFVNALAHAGIGWSPAMGVEDPLYRKVDELVHRVLNEFTDDIFLFDELRKDLENFLAEEEKNAEVNIQSSADEIDRRDREELARVVSHAEVERRLEASTVPNFLGSFLRDKWMATLALVHAREGEEGEAWVSTVATLDDLVWSVQPKRSAEERRKLIGMLPSLLRRLHTGLQGAQWEPGEREQFMSNLVEAHAAAVKPSLATAKMPTTVVAEAAAAAAEEAKAKGDVETAAKASALAEAMAPAPPPPPPEPAVEVVRDRYAEIAATLERGMWIEFEGEDGQLAFAKLAWVSPLRGTYLFTNRQGQKAVSLTADELAARFRNDRARLVEAEPLVDRAFVQMISSLGEKLNERTA